MLKSDGDFVICEEINTYGIRLASHLEQITRPTDPRTPSRRCLRRACASACIAWPPEDPGEDVVSLSRCPSCKLSPNLSSRISDCRDEWNIEAVVKTRRPGDTEQMLTKGARRAAKAGLRSPAPSYWLALTITCSAAWTLGRYKPVITDLIRSPPSALFIISTSSPSAFDGPMNVEPQTLPRKRKRHVETGIPTPESTLPVKKPKLNVQRIHRTPSSFYDNLSHIDLVPRALREFERRLSKVLPPESPDPAKLGVSIPKRFARHGGPDLTDLRSV